MKPPLAVSLLLLLLPGTGSAGPIVSVDVDPLLAGIQSAVEVLAGNVFSVDVVVDGIEPGNPLNAFEFDLLYDSTQFIATELNAGGFLLSPFLLVESEVGPPEVQFTALTLGPFGATGSGVLASISFLAIATGTSALALNDVVLSAPFGQVIPDVSLNGGAVRITGQTVPEPATVFLFLFGIAVAALATAKQRYAT